MMNIKPFLAQKDLLLVEFIVLYLLYNKEYEEAKLLIDRSGVDVLSNLQVLGYIKLMGTDLETVTLRAKANDLFTVSKSNPRVRAEHLSEMIRAIFPPGTNAGGYRYRGDKQGVLDKLTKFVKKYPNYEDEEIIQATRQYVNRFKPDFVGMRQCHYFITKDNTSDLLGELENLNTDNIIEDSNSFNTMI